MKQQRTELNTYYQKDLEKEQWAIDKRHLQSDLLAVSNKWLVSIGALVYGSEHRSMIVSIGYDSGHWSMIVSIGL